MLVRRLIQLVVVVILVTMFTALLISFVPGKPEQVLIPFGTDQQRQALRHDLHLDEPVYQQYWEWLDGFAHGNLGCFYGTSGYTTQSTCPDKVADRVKVALPISLYLMLYAQVLSLVIAIPLGVLTAYRAGTWLDKGVNAGAFFFLAIPNFVLALILAFYVGTKAGWLPPTSASYKPPGEDFNAHFRAMALPVICLAAGQVAVYMRLLRSDMIATLQEDFVTMAKAKGLKPSRILWRHALRPSSLTLLTVAGLNVGTLIGGAVVIEQLFALPGMGTLIADAIFRRQYPALQSYVAIVALLYVGVNFAIDILYGVLDPRIRHARTIG